MAAGTSVGRYTLANGKTMYRVRIRDAKGKTTDRRGFTSKAAANREAARILTEMVDGIHVSHSEGQAKVGPYFERWMATKVRVRATTKAARQSAWDTRVRERWADVAISDITTSDIEMWVGELTAKGVGVASIESAVLVLRGALSVAAKDGKLARGNPALGVEIQDRDPVERAVLSMSQMYRLADEMGGTDGLIVRTLALSAMRIGELTALRVCDVDLQRGLFLINGSITEIGGSLSERTLPKNGKTRLTILDPSLVDELDALMTGKGSEDPVFTAPDGGTFRGSMFRRRRWYPAIRRIQQTDPTFPTVVVHSLRNLLITEAREAGVPDVTVQHAAGHANMAMTDHYTRGTVDALSVMRAKVAARAKAARTECSCRTESAGTRRERVVLDRSCPVHRDHGVPISLDNVG